MAADTVKIPLTRLRRLRLRAVMRFARWMGVPVDVHCSFFMRKGAQKPVVAGGWMG